MAQLILNEKETFETISEAGFKLLDDYLKRVTFGAMINMHYDYADESWKEGIISKEDLGVHVTRTTKIINYSLDRLIELGEQ